MPVKKQTQKQSQIVQVIIGAAILDKLKKRKPKKKKVKRKAKPIEEDLREPYRRNRYMKPLKYKQTFPAYGANNMIMQQTENQRNNRILSDLTQRVNQYERLLKQKPNPINKFIIREAQEIKEEDEEHEEKVISRDRDSITPSRLGIQLHINCLVGFIDCPFLGQSREKFKEKKSYRPIHDESCKCCMFLRL